MTAPVPRLPTRPISPISPISPCWLLACLLIGSTSLALWLAAAFGLIAAPALIWRADGWLRQPWTLWTAALTHFLPAHALSNVLALSALGVLGHALGAQRRDVLALLLAWPLATSALQHWPTLGGYYGLSLLVHAAAGVLTVRALSHRSSRHLGEWMLVALCIKLWLEKAWAIPTAFDARWGFNIVYAAHLTGYACGLTAGALAWAYTPIMKVVYRPTGGR